MFFYLLRIGSSKNYFQKLRNYLYEKSEISRSGKRDKCLQKTLEDSDPFAKNNPLKYDHTDVEKFKKTARSQRPIYIGF